MNSREKGKRGEREWAEKLRALGLKARRGAQFSGSPDSPDVVGGWDGTHAEVKRVENLDIPKAVQQAVRDCGAKVPYVAHRKNGGEWFITIRAEDWFKFYTACVNTPKPRKTRHTCGLDGDPGAVAPLDGRCVACEGEPVKPGSSFLCNHANEVPCVCPCKPDCYCRREGSCK